jgi:hypothetical protein
MFASLLVSRLVATKSYFVSFNDLIFYNLIYQII